MTQSQLVPMLNQGTISPLTAMEWQQLGIKTLAVAAVDNIRTENHTKLATIGGWAKFYQWPGQVIAWGGIQAPFKKINKNTIKSGATYWRQQQAKKLTLSDYESWSAGVQADIVLPLAQAAPYYGPVDDIDRAVEVNLAWQNQHLWGVVQGAGLKRSHQHSIQGLLDQGVQNFVLGGNNQHLPFDEWQRINEAILAMLPDGRQTMIMVSSLAELQQAISWEIDYVLTDLPRYWNRHRKIFWSGQLVDLSEVNDASIRLMQEETVLGERLLMSYNWQQLNNLLKNND